MKKLLIFFVCSFLLTFDVKAEVVNPEAVSNFLSRILGQRTTDNGQQLIVTILDENLAQQLKTNSQQPKTNSQMLLLSHLKTENLV
jgi:hypothetical protein